MSRITVNDRDPYEHFRDQAADQINDSQTLSDIKQNPLMNRYDRGGDVPTLRNIDKDELADIADRTSRSLRGATNQQREQAEEFLRQRGIEPPRRRFYSIPK